MKPNSDNLLPTNIPAFLSKLWKMVNDPNTDHLIRWSSDGHSFVIENQAEFWYTLLPLYYKHNNMSSFIRQLNMYGFHKLNADGGADGDKDEIKFFHPHFQQGQPNTTRFIKRKISATKSSTSTVGADSQIKPVDQIQKVLQDVKQLRNKQEAVDSELVAMKAENGALWRELILLRQKHLKQQQIVNKLIHFLVTIVQPTRNNSTVGLGVKRRYPLMINDARESKPSKRNNHTSDGPTIHELDSELHTDDISPESQLDTKIDSPLSASTSKSVNSTSSTLLDIPIIDNCDTISGDSTVVADLLSESDLNSVTPTPAEFPIEEVDFPKDINSDNMFDVTELVDAGADIFKEATNKLDDTQFSETLEKIQYQNDLSVVPKTNGISQNQQVQKTRNTTDRELSLTTRENIKLNNANDFFSTDLDSHLETTQDELDNIKEILFDGYTFDANSVLGLFNHEDDLPMNLPEIAPPPEEKPIATNEISGNYDPMVSGSELISYPKQFETTSVMKPFVVDFASIFDDLDESSEPVPDTFCNSPESDPLNVEINTPVICKKEPSYPVSRSTNYKK